MGGRAGGWFACMTMPRRGVVRREKHPTAPEMRHLRWGERVSFSERRPPDLHPHVNPMCPFTGMGKETLPDAAHGASARTLAEEGYRTLGGTRGECAC
jgi:hypothetical protein